MECKSVGSRIPAVIVRGELNGLGVVRSLARGGVPSIVMDTTLRHAAMWSRFAERHVVPQLSGNPFIEHLRALQNKLGDRPVLILTDEMAVHTVSEYRDEIGPYYRFHLPSHAMVSTLSNKAEFQALAEAHDMPVPKAVVIERESDIERIAALGMPVIAKPADKRPVHLGQVERINLLDKLDDALAACRRMWNAAGTIVVQEWIDGPDSSIYFALFHCGADPSSRSIFFGRKIAAYPPGLGSTAVCVPAAEATDLLRPLTEKFIDVTRYEGLGSLEFKWDTRGRRFVIIEPTVGRTDWQEEIATLNGVNLPLIAYCHELGLPAPPRQPANSSAWRESLLHLRSCTELGERIFDGYLRLDDPWPALVFWADLAVRRACRLFTYPVFERRKPPFRRRRTA